MGVSVRKDGAWKDATVFAKKADVWKPAAVSVKKAGSWEDVLAPLGCEVDIPSFAEYLTDTTGTTAAATVTATGGATPYSYAWSKDSGSSEISVDDPTDDETTFSLAGGVFGQVYSAIFRCTVTDDNGATTFALVSVFFQVDYPS